MPLNPLLTGFRRDRDFGATIVRAGGVFFGSPGNVTFLTFFGPPGPLRGSPGGPKPSGPQKWVWNIPTLSHVTKYYCPGRFWAQNLEKGHDMSKTCFSCYFIPMLSLLWKSGPQDPQGVLRTRFSDFWHSWFFTRISCCATWHACLQKCIYMLHVMLLYSYRGLAHHDNFTSCTCLASSDMFCTSLIKKCIFWACFLQYVPVLVYVCKNVFFEKIFIKNIFLKNFLKNF